MNQRLFLWSITASLAGFLFGFDTVVISGAEQAIQSLWHTTDAVHGLTLSMALWGTVLGSLVGRYPAESVGRRKTLIGIGVVYLFSAIWSGLASDPTSLMLARLIGGVGVGISTVAAPMFIAEISPPAVRGRLTALFQFSIVFGILIAFASNALIGWIEPDITIAWRWMMGIEAIPAVIYTVLCLKLPESPRWLATKGDNIDAAIKVIETTQPDLSPDQIAVLVDEMATDTPEHDTPEHDMPETDAQSQAATESRDRFWSKRLRTPITIAFLIAAFNQLSGINAILYFSPRIFALTGMDSDSARVQSIAIGVVNLVFTLLGVYLIDRIGRRTLLIIGSVGYILSLGLCTLVFAINADHFRVAAAAIDLKTAVGSNASPEIITTARDDLQRSFEIGGLTEPDLSLVEPEQLAATAAFYIRQSAEDSGDSGFIVLVCILVFIASHAVGQGAVIWVLISEVFPNRHRAAGQSLGSFTHWIFAAGLTLVFPSAVNLFSPAAIFGFFAAMMGLQLAWVLTKVPETGGVPLEQIQAKLQTPI